MIKNFIIMLLIFLPIVIGSKNNYYIAIKQKNLEYLTQKAYQLSDPNSNEYGKYLNQTEINKIVTNPYRKQKILRWIENHLLFNKMNITDLGDTIKISSRNDYFNTMFKVKSNLDRKINKIIMQYQIPDVLQNDIDFIISSKKQMPKTFLKVSKKNNMENYITPYSIRKLYNITQSSDSRLSTQAPAEFQGDTCIDISSLKRFAKSSGINEPIIEEKHVIGDCDLNTSFPDVEATLDIQYQYGTNDNVTQYYVSQQEWMYGFAIELFNAPSIPSVISMSWGWAEREQCEKDVFPICYINVPPEEYTKRTNIEFMKLSMMGVTLVASSGDAGAPGRTSEGCDPQFPLNPVFPTSSPWVTSVGGTVILNPETAPNSTRLPEICQQNKCIVGGKELNCDFDRTGWTSGGGISNYFERPYWQVNASEEYLNSNISKPPEKYYNKHGRIYPDISLVAHNYLIYMNGESMSVDGTSASSPVFSGMVSRLNGLRIKQGKPVLGALGPLLYNMHRDCKRCFYDVVEGSNNSTENTNCPLGYTAGKGFDPVYGLGLPNFGEMYNYLENM
jgi:subtilase family serine protease